MNDLSSRPAPPHFERLLGELLDAQFGPLDAATRAFLGHHLRWVELPAGATLMRQGEAGDAGYLLVSGRLRAYISDNGGAPRLVREMSRGEVIGELSMYTGDARSATVVAVRDCVLVRLDRAHFEALLATSAATSIVFTRQIIRRLQSQHQRRPLAAPVTIGVIAVSDGVAIAGFARTLAAQLGAHGRVRIVDAAAVDALVDRPGAARGEDADSAHRVAGALDDLESQHDFLLLVASDGDDAWTRRCIGHADELLLVADASCPPRLHPIESRLLAERPEQSEAAEILVLLQPATRRTPSGTRAWLARRPVAGHVHVRRDHEADLARLARLVSRNATGLVFGGGGARGFAHLGVWRALQAAGVQIDCVGGTSIGAVMAALVAADPSVERAIEIARRGFGVNPTGDYNWLPLVSLIKGGRARAAIERSLAELAGEAVDVEDLWKNYFCIATNYSQAREQLLDRGPLARALLASIAIPGALPPVVHDGDLLCDGGTFNNFPVDRMRALRGVGRVIGVDLGVRTARRIEFDEVPGSWALLRDRLRPRGARRYRLPSLTSYLMNITILYSVSQQSQARALADLYFNPPLYKVGLLQWSRFDDILRQGERHALEVIGALEPARRAALGMTTAAPG
ncbi:MAG: patatin-like phospholipase domain-containing protein [Burkholderiaceae bacterium]|jgi:NTE family protein|nr:patatin-like phospholipase domain-containing protein [Burkholderiaceae bacterium]